MDNSSKKFLSCFLLALSLNRNACSMDKFLVSLMVPIITVGALALLPNPFSNKIPVNKKIAPRRPGDIDACYASTDKAYEELGFKAEYNVEDMCRDSYNFVRNNK